MPGAFQLELTPFVAGLRHSTYLTHAGDGTGRLFVVEQTGRIRIVADGRLRDQPFLDIATHVSIAGDERGLFSLAFDPDYRANGYFYLDYTRKPDGAVVVMRYRVSPDDPDQADPTSATPVLVVNKSQPNHNGGQLQFGPDGDLYVGLGDGGGAGDRHGTIGNGQDRTTLFGKILRLAVTDPNTLTVPATNPFAGRADVRPEIWALGLRNPWRFSFDRATGDLYIADVGQNIYEEVNFQPALSTGGENYGWRTMEGLHCYDPAEGCDQTGLTLPVAEYTHAQGCAVIGGYVYRGESYPWLQGVYFFADYCTGVIWSLERDASGAWQTTKRLETGFSISSFGEDEQGELYVIEHEGTIYRLGAVEK